MVGEPKWTAPGPPAPGQRLLAPYRGLINGQAAMSPPRSVDMMDAEIAKLFELGLMALICMV